MSDKIWFLKRCDLFERLAPAEAERLERHAVMRTFGRGEVIYFPTEPGQSVLLLARGRVKIKDITPDGKEAIFAFIEEGELFGELAVLDSQPRNEYAETVLESQIVVIPRDDMLWLMGRKSDIALGLTKLVGLRRRRIENRLRNIVFRSNRDRILLLLAELLETHGEQVGGLWEIRLRLSHQELASLIGATRETVTVTLGQLQFEGLIRAQRRHIVVLDRQRLVAEAGGSPVPPAVATSHPRARQAALPRPGTT